MELECNSIFTLAYLLTWYIAHGTHGLQKKWDAEGEGASMKKKFRALPIFESRRVSRAFLNESLRTS